MSGTDIDNAAAA